MTIKKTSRPELLEQTQSLFAQHGYMGTTIEKIAKAVLIKKAAVFYYTTSKEELAIQTIQAFHQRCVDALFQIIAKKEHDLEKKQNAFSQAVANFLLKEPHAVFITLLNLECNNSKTQRIKATLQDHIDYWRSALLLIFGQKNKETVWDNPALLDVQRTLALHKFLPHVGFDFI